MKTELCRPSELGSLEIETWRALQAADPRLANPFLSASFAQVVGDVDPQARVAVISDGPTVCAFLPFSIVRRGVAAGLAHGVAACHGMVHGPEFDYPLVQVLSDCNLAVFELRAFLSRFPTPLLDGVRSVPTHVIDISSGFDAYMGERKACEPRYFNWLRRKRNRMELDLGPVEFTTGRLDLEALEWVITWKSNQYRRSGWPDPFSKPWVRHLVHALAETNEPDLVGRISACRVEEAVLAVDFSLYSPTVYAGWFVSYNPEYARYSPGSVRWLYVIEAAAALGVEQLDIGPGDERYKVKLAGKELPMLEGRVARSCLRSAVHRARTAPRHAATDFILSHPRVRRGVRSSLRAAGKLRSPQPPVEVWA